MRGHIELPGDKSISHRIAMLAAIAEHDCLIENFNTGADCQSTLGCLRRLGASTHGNLLVHPARLAAPAEPLDCGNSGSTLRMLLGLLAGQNIPATLIGDLSLLRRPMQRVAAPLRHMGAVIDLRDENFAPVILREGVKRAAQHHLTIASAQVKSAGMLAGLRFPDTRVTESVPTRDHTERLFEYLQLHRNRGAVPAFHYTVPGDPSSAAFFVAGALLHPDSDLTISNLLLNPFRVAYLRKLQHAGAKIDVVNRRLIQNEFVGDVRVRGGDLRNPIDVRPQEVPSLIDEIPVLSILGTRCGFRVSGAGELRFKESDRIEAMVANLRALSIEVKEWDDGYQIHPGNLREGMAHTYGDHRIAMAFAVAGLEIDDPECIKISLPEFFTLLQSLSDSGSTMI